MTKSSNKLLVTGGAGYIGQNLIHFFLQKKFKIYVIDNFSTSSKIKKNILKKINFYKIDLANKEKVKKFFKNKNFDLIIHLAAFSGVNEFNRNLLKSFNNNVLATKNLVEFGFNKKNTKFIFASSAAVYGKVTKKKVEEKDRCKPANYYGLSKVACENIINQALHKKKINYAILRYFNVVGTLIDFPTEKKILSLFDRIKQNVKKRKYKININGNNFDTLDGTPERDFIHIRDLCNIHLEVSKYLKKNKKIVLNCGSGFKYSVLKVVKEFERKIKRRFNISYKLINSDETQTICSDMKLLKKELKTKIMIYKLNDLVKDYL